MAFRFKLAEPFEEGCRRIAREQIERAQSQLKGPTDPIIAVHETRKTLKRLRALLRLIRPALGDQVFRLENGRLREIGRLLSSARDRHVLLETVSKLEAEAGSPRKSLCQAVRSVINGANGSEGSGVDAMAIKEAYGRLADADKRFARLRLAGTGFEIVGPGLEACYRKARRAFATAYAEGTDEAFHEWRKGTQQHWRHMMLLTRAWSNCMGARTAEARQLSQILGDDHDLVLLIAFIHSPRAHSLGSERAATMEALARNRQKELRTLAHPMGRRLFAEGAKNLERRIAAYWEAAAALKEQDELDDDEASSRAPSKAAPKSPARKAPAKAPSRRRRGLAVGA